MSELLHKRDPLLLAVADAGLAASTLKRYGGHMRSWLVYCVDNRLDPIDAPTESVLHWLQRELGKGASESQLRVCLASIRLVQKHHALALESRDVQPYTCGARTRLDAFVRSLVRDDSQRKKRRALPICAPELVRVVRAARRVDVRKRQSWDAALALARRDAAMLLVGWWGAFRADELSRLQWSDVERCDQGLVLRMRGAKHRDVLIALASKEPSEFCPVRSLSEWFDSQQEHELRIELLSDAKEHVITSRVFGVTAHTVDVRVRVHCAAAGLVGRYTGHSLRAGFATEASRQGVNDRAVREHAGWKSVGVHAGYVREGQLWLKSPTTQIRVEG